MHHSRAMPPVLTLPVGQGFLRKNSIERIGKETDIMRHLIDFGDLAREEWDELYQRAQRVNDALRRRSSTWTYAGAR